MTDVFNNEKSFSGLQTTNGCSGTYTPNPADPTAGRKMAVYFSIDGGAPQALPVLNLNPVPSALQAYSVNGYGSGELLKVDSSVNQGVQNNSPLNQSQYDEFWRLVTNPLTAYLPPTGDVNLVSGNNKVTALLGQALPAGAPTNNQILVSNGTSWTLQPLSSGSVGSVGANLPLTITGTASAPVINLAAATGAADGYLSSTDWNIFNEKQSSALGSAKIWVGNSSGKAAEVSVSGDATISDSGELTLAPTITAGGPTGGASTIPVITYDAKGRLIAVSTATADDTTKLPLAGGTMAGALNMGGFDLTNTGAVSMANNKYFGLSDFAGAPGTTAGQMWYDNGKIKYFDGTIAQELGVAAAGITNLNGSTVSTQSFMTPGTSGNAPDWSFNAGAGEHTLNIPMAATSGSVTAGLISNADYSTMMSKQSNALASAEVWVGNASGGAEARSFSGDIASVSNVGLVTVNKTTTGLANTIVSTDGTGTIDAYGYGIKGSTSGTVDLLTQATTANYALTFPAAAPGADQMLQSDASGNFSWVNTPSFSMPGLAAGNIWVGNSAGGYEARALSGDATVSDIGLLTLKNTGAVGTYFKVTTDAQGRVVAGAALASGDVTDALGYTPLNKAGDTMIGGLSMANNTYFGLSNYAGAPGAVAGQIWYDAGKVKYFDGTTAHELGVAGAGITNLNGSTVSTQSFMTPGTSGNAPDWSFNAGAGEHTLNIPMASASGSVTAGLISNADYSSMMSKQSNALASADVWIGNASGGAEARTLSGDATISNVGLLTLKNTGSVGTYFKVETDAQGRVVAGSALASGDVTGALGYTPVNRAGDTMLGALIMGGFDLTNTGAISMANNKYFGLSTFAGAPGTAAGQIWYDAGKVKYFDGTTAHELGVAGAGITNLNGSTVSTQSFMTPGTSGNAPDWSFNAGAGEHTLNIPMASAAGSVTAGLISNADYSSMMSKMSNTLASAEVWVGNASGGAEARALSGDIASVSNVGLVTVNKSTTGLANTIVSTDGTGTIDAYGYGIKGSTSGTVDLLSQATTANYALTFPAAAPGADQMLQSDASGNFSWVNTPSFSMPGLAAGNIWVGNSAGGYEAHALSGDATVSDIGLLTLKNTGSVGTYFKVETDAQGRVVTGSALASGDVTGALGYTPVNKAGDTMIGGLSMANNTYFGLSNYAGAPGAVAGQIWYDAGKVKYFDGTSAKELGVAGAGITNLNGSTVSTQSFMTPGTSGNAPAWSFNAGAGEHTLNIPMAAASGSVTAGLISNADYSSMMSKQSNALAASQVWVGNASGGAEARALSGDISTVSNVGLVTVNKTTTGEANKIISLDGTGVANVKGLDIQTGTGKVTLQTSGAFTNYVLTMPVDDGNANQVLVTNGSGVLSWAAASGADHLGNHTATMNIALGSNWLSGDGGNEGISVNSTGMVGIGTTNPQEALTVVGRARIGTAYNTPGHAFEVAGGSAIFSGGSVFISGGELTVDGGDAYFTGGSVFIPGGELTVDGGGAYFTGGNVGIGTSSPSDMLHVEGGAILAGPKGTATGDGGELQFGELAANGTNYVGFRAPDSIDGSVVWRLPAADGSANQVLTTDGAGALSWGSPSASSITSGTLAVANGGTGANSFTANGLVMAGATSTSALTSITCVTTGGLLEWNGTTWSCSKDFLTSGSPSAKVNYVLMGGGPTGSGVSVAAAGSDANVSLDLSAKGSGSLNLSSSGAVNITGAQGININETLRLEKTYVETTNAAANSGTAYTIPANFNIVRVNLTGNATITLPSVPVSSTKVFSLTVKVTQDAVGSRTLTWSPGAASIKWDSGTEPAPATGANQTSIYQFLVIGDENIWYATQVWKE